MSVQRFFPGCISNFRTSFWLWSVKTSAAGGLSALADVPTSQRKFEIHPILINSKKIPIFVLNQLFILKPVVNS
jgi:hypothetical protein